MRRSNRHSAIHRKDFRPEDRVTFREAFWVWVKVAVYSFGGPTGQIAVMHRLLVEDRRWVSENRFLHALNYCMFLPGPEAQQLATYIGWLLHGVRGGLVAGTLFILPGFISILFLSILYAGFRNVEFVEALFYGLKPAVVAVVAQAVFRISGCALKNRVMILLAILAFVAIFVFDVPFPLIVVAAAVTGFVGGRLRPAQFSALNAERDNGKREGGRAAPVLTDGEVSSRPAVRRDLLVTAIWGSLWIAPLLVLGSASANPVYLTEGIFFSKAAVVTFGGAYAVLAYIAQEAVHTYAWLRPGEMLDGLGMAETTPGPLIQVVQFVGFMGAYRNPGSLDPMIAGILGSLITTWVTFIPCFLWIFLGAPYIEYLRGNRFLSTALSGITAAVVGVVANLAVWFSLHVLFVEVSELRIYGMRLLLPVAGTLDLIALGISLGAFLALFRFKIGMIKTLTAGALLGLGYQLSLG